MPTFGRLTWSERLDAIQARMNEATSGVDPQIGVPYFDRTEIERVLLEVSNANLRELSIEDLDLVAASAITEVSAPLSPVAHPVTAIDIISARLDSDPCIEVTPAMFLQNGYGVAQRMYSVYGGNIDFTVTAGNGVFEVLTYLPLATWQSTYDILPPGYDEKTIAETCEILEISDYAPVERT